MSDYSNFVNFLTAAQRGRHNSTPKITPPRAKPTAPRSPATTSDAVLKAELIAMFNGR